MSLAAGRLPIHAADRGIPPLPVTNNAVAAVRAGGDTHHVSSQGMGVGKPWRPVDKKTPAKGAGVSYDRERQARRVGGF